jgi:hypothetical protein
MSAELFVGLINEAFLVHSKTNITIMTFGSNYHPNLTGMSQATGAVVFAEQLAAAKSALEHAVTQQNLTHAIAKQAQVFAEEAVQDQVQAHEVLADVQRPRAAIIGPVEIAEAYAAVEMMEITASKMCVWPSTRVILHFGRRLVLRMHAMIFTLPPTLSTPFANVKQGWI